MLSKLSQFYLYNTVSTEREGRERERCGGGRKKGGEGGGRGDGGMSKLGIHSTN